MTTTSTKYPFLTKTQILSVIATDDEVMLQCLQLMDLRQTPDERETLTTRYKNACGWMSSHSVNAGNLAKKAREGALSSEETSQARAIVMRYGRQLASHFRAETIALNPELKEVAAIFGAD